ncbi:ABC transporter permease [Estrella lausannensis]|uniref:ABC-type transporter, permease subunit n=1 Tax=Estrella lausannensis TaxID=483423 RepID=A0A0H5DR84_9BACT|nr:ABC transporter permease [Estrella lausannensis]CRX38169.1 ABC-type transporter, permease subunit [Estrella lausannensis]
MRVYQKAGLFLLLCLIAVSLAGPFFSGHPYDAIDLEMKNQPPGAVFVFGSDDLGRDVFTRTCIGLRISLLIGAAAAIIDLFIGVTIGAFAALSGKRTEALLMRIADAIYAMPYVLIVLFFLLVLGPGILSMMISLASIGWITLARISLNQFKVVSENDYVRYAKAQGASKSWILRKHLLPNSAKTIAAAMTMTVPTAIFTESFLSFLGLGVQAPMASLGTMISESVSAIEYYPWRIIPPLVAVALLILSFNLLAEMKMEASSHESQSA